jgi:hypothetical protein
MEVVPMAKTTATYLTISTALASILAAQGCREQADNPKGGTPGGAAHAGSSQSMSPVAEGEDDPRAPDCFPRTRKDGPWIKGEAIKVLAPAELSKVLPGEESNRLGMFRINSLARCAYQLPHSSLVPIASLLVVSTDSPDDAYGIMSCRCDAAETFRIAQETRVQRGDGVTLHCWQGKAYIAAHIAQPDSEATEELIRLMVYVTGKIKKESTPPLLDIVPRDASSPGRRWLVRNLASLPPDALEGVGPLDERRISEVLGLGRDAIACVATYAASGTARPNAVWAIRYPAVKPAHDAFARYERYLKANPRDSVAQSTSILPAQGMHLMGTWTAEEESMQYVLPRIRQLLPN